MSALQLSSGKGPCCLRIFFIGSKNLRLHSSIALDD